MDDQKTLDAINSLDFIKSDADGEICYYVDIEDTFENRNVLLNAGFTEAEIAAAKEISNEGALDVSQLAWSAGASWWTGEKFVVEAEGNAE